MDVLDWELWERLVELVSPYLPDDSSSGSMFFVSDNRGQYDVRDLDALRAEVEKQEEPPETIRMTFMRATDKLFFNVYASGFIGSGGRIQSEDEATVNHLAARVSDLFAVATKRHGPQEPRSATESTQHDDAPLVSVNRAKLQRIHYDPWVIGIGTAVVAGVILGLVLTH